MDLFGKSKRAEFSVNKKFANRYDTYRRKEEIQKLKDKHAVDGDSSSDSESEDENAEALTPQLEKNWLRTLAAIKAKDPKIYNKEYAFYHESTSSSQDGSDKDEQKEPSKEKPVYLKDYDRKLILEKDGVVSDSDSEGERTAKPPGYYEEQEAIKKSFKSFVDEDSDAGSDDFLTKRAKTKQELEKEEEDYLQWMKGNKDELEGDEVKVGVELNPLRDYWQDPKLSEGEKFLRDYILNKGYQEEDDTLPTYDEVVGEGEVDDSADEADYAKQELFMHKYNFRFEDPDQEFIKSYPRTLESSLRRKDTQRKEKREEVKQRKAEEKAKKMDELKQLRNMKKKEVMEKIGQLKAAAGAEELQLSEGELDEDFDPEKHDKLMQDMFDDDYYGEEGEDAEKPVFSDLEDGPEDWDEYGQEPDEESVAGDDSKASTSKQATASLDHHDNEEDAGDSFNMDADYDANIDIEMDKMVKRKGRKSKLSQAVMKKKPVYNPDDATFEQYLDEFYKLDYEDVIGDTPCRFKYRSVVANDFGLSTEEVLSAREQELNKWVSVKKMFQYRPMLEEKKDVRVFTKRKDDMHKKRMVFTSLVGDGKIEEEEDAESDEELDVNRLTPATAPDTEKTQAPQPGASAAQQASSASLRKARKRAKKKQSGAALIDAEDSSQPPQTQNKKRKQEPSENAPETKRRKSVDQHTVTKHPANEKSNTRKPMLSPKKAKNNQMQASKNKMHGHAKRPKPNHSKAKGGPSNKSPGKPGEFKGQGQKKRVRGPHVPVDNVSDERLKAYGLNPKKLKYTHPQLKIGQPYKKKK